ncbi:deoxyribodipyrimidine photo-lyase [Bacillus mesophilus]|uniref:Deoxyribodipyrimidine photo-lyase n=1 Tax=Bacillus mesophilus TaxID=1808955 RepID=A0A6M0QBA7_9BACI|nr:deoxyribodipyrimidine photo-lyase [Bacillus mesophilus]MBM7662331.1 deoxyribodipyrimidine photo-lyase [Bacillus mesophilus]NEY73039.1 deoxyribodipyrimidine photo-lyase [Bacillus mesophilus]
MKKIIVWLRRDLRLHDHPALWEASQQGIVIPVFIWSKEEETHLHSSPTSKWWLHHSLYALQKTLFTKGISLIIRSGNNSLHVLKTLVEETGADSLYFNERMEPDLYLRDQLILKELNLIGIKTRCYCTNQLVHPSQIVNKSGGPYKVFTPFYKRLLKEFIPRPFPIPSNLRGLNQKIDSLFIEQLDLLPIINWDQKLHRHWIPGEVWGITQWTSFLSKSISRYQQDRDYPYTEASSALSPYLASGDLSIRALWYAALRFKEQHDELEGQVDAFLRQLAWREFSYYQLWHHPSITEHPLRESFREFPWNSHIEQKMDSWKKGKTGYPLVDAGMRQLWETGTMHNRIRMVAASFLVKHLLINWTEGAKWFQHTLVDFDLANNAMGWQWIAGTGFDSAPYFRIFNPIKQSEQFDQDGEYIRRWVPELSKLSAPYIHRPWEAQAELLKAAGIVLGETYPNPIVDHQMARERALKAYSTIKG